MVVKYDLRLPKNVSGRYFPDQPNDLISVFGAIDSPQIFLFLDDIVFVNIVMIFIIVSLYLSSNLHFVRIWQAWDEAGVVFLSLILRGNTFLLVSCKMHARESAALVLEGYLV